MFLITGVPNKRFRYKRTLLYNYGVGAVTFLLTQKYNQLRLQVLTFIYIDLLVI